MSNRVRSFASAAEPFSWQRCCILRQSSAGCCRVALAQFDVVAEFAKETPSSETCSIRTHNPLVAGSSPAGPTKRSPATMREYHERFGRAPILAGQPTCVLTMHFTYVLKCSDGEWYVGLTDDINGRVSQHQQGLVSATKFRVPVELIYFEACRSRQAAAAREIQFKTGFGRGYLKRRLAHES